MRFFLFWAMGFGAWAVPIFALAHSFGQSYTLPLPYWLYLYGGGAAIAVSFLIIAYFGSGAERRSGQAAQDLSRFGIVRLFSSGPVLILLKILSVAVFLLVLVSAFLGTQSAERNFLVVFFWIAFAIGFVYVVAVFGDIWTALNPLKILAELYRRPPYFSYPSWLGYSPALFFYFIFIWIELISGGKGGAPHFLAWAIVIYTVITLLGAALFGHRAWFRYGEFFSVFFRLIGDMAPIAYRNGRIYLRRPFVGLLDDGCEHFSLVIFILFMLSSTAFDGFRETAVWAGLSTAVVGHLGLAGRYAPVFFSTFALILAPLLFAALYAAAIVSTVLVMKFLVRSRQSLFFLMRQFALSLVPIALAYHLAHNVSAFLVRGQSIIPLLSDPLGWGYDFFRTAHFTPQVGIVGIKTIWHIQVAAIVGGHIVSVWVAHLAALTLFKERRRAVLSQFSMLALMVVYTTAGLWILSQPLGLERNYELDALRLQFYRGTWLKLELDNGEILYGRLKAAGGRILVLDNAHFRRLENEQLTKMLGLPDITIFDPQAKKEFTNANNIFWINRAHVRAQKIIPNDSFEVRGIAHALLGIENRRRQAAGEPIIPEATTTPLTQ